MIIGVITRVIDIVFTTVVTRMFAKVVTWIVFDMGCS